MIDYVQFNPSGSGNESDKPIGNWVILYEERELIVAELVEARLQDEGIEYYTLNKLDLGYALECGANWTNKTSGRIITILVHPEDEEKAKAIIEEDRSKLLEDPNLDFGTPEES
jgi:hypothetical protein